VGCIAEVELVLSAGAAVDIAAVDAILSWNPDELTFIDAVPTSGLWITSGFLNDPDGINANLLDGDALFTGLVSPVAPVDPSPAVVAATFRFLVKRDAQVGLLASLGAFGTTKVLGTTPGEYLTGTLSKPSVITSVGGTWTDLGGGTPGIAGTPTLVGDGELGSGCPTSVTLTNAPPGAPILAWISVAPTPFPALGGTVHAFPFVNQLLFSADGSGSFVGSTNWPTGMPAGTDVWFQFLVQDMSTLHGITLSNGLRATTPTP
jgi:hypothetical protein